ncbi:short-chain dehydrogenases protein [Purpureocillium lavendulum]|uniref:Short-chain dehydrogenases protein n=1 Tax=Purpureocillium lavendulum TaxID=1247861 RepID=A0AB34FPP2_9HYPO|nr:short-chain dehydrogenases protein [Purpureocillium lavendulum]
MRPQLNTNVSMEPSRVLLILGGGANIGASVARAFAANGYKVAVTSRTARPNGEAGVDLHVQGDLSDPSSVPSIFQKVVQSLGPPSVVVYNGQHDTLSLSAPSVTFNSNTRNHIAAAATPNPPDDPLALSVEDLNRDLQVNTTSVLVAAREATALFATLPASAPRAFIYTGNVLNKRVIAPLLGLGIGKSATAHLIASASQVYGPKGYRFYYADERQADGSPVYKDISGPAAGEFYSQLAESGDRIPWEATFVAGKGYVDFSQ